MADARHDLADTESPAPAAPSAEDREADENVFVLLAHEARTRTPHELWVTTVGGGVSAVLLLWQNPSLSWLGAGFVATAAYGMWGLLDRAASARLDVADVDRRGVAQLRGLRDLVALVGTGAAFWAVLDFMGAALGGWRH